MNKLRLLFIAGVTSALFIPSQFVYANPSKGATKQDPVEVVTTDEDDDVIDDNLILTWSENRRVITGADILGRLLRGIVTRDIVHSTLD